MRTIYIYALALLFLAFNACKKIENTDVQLVAINVVNINPDISPIKVNLSNRNTNWSTINTQVDYGANGLYYAPVGTLTLKAVAASDTGRLLLNANLNLTGKLYTLYLLGNSMTAEHMLVEESNFPYIRLDQPKAPSVDSVVNIRFTNLSSNSPALKINIEGRAASEVTNLTYKSSSNWKAYANNGEGVSYIFEVRNAATNDFLFSYTFVADQSNLFRNVTLVIKGDYGTTSGSNAFSISPINYF